MSAFSEYILLSSGNANSLPISNCQHGNIRCLTNVEIFKLELFFRLVFGFYTFRSIEKVFFSLKVCLGGR